MPKSPNLMFKCICLVYNVKETWTLKLKPMNVSSFDTPRKKDEIVLEIVYFLQVLEAIIFKHQLTKVHMGTCNLLVEPTHQNPWFSYQASQ